LGKPKLTKVADLSRAMAGGAAATRGAISAGRSDATSIGLKTGPEITGARSSTGLGPGCLIIRCGWMEIGKGL
jgi:hypothetical protein